MVGAGLLVESIGSFAKYSIVDRWDGKREDILRAWDDYLKIAWKTEPIGARYLRRVLTTFKFELNMLVAILGTLPGIALLAYYYVLPSHAVVWTLAIAVASLLYLFKAALEDSRVLHRLRGELIVVARAQDALPPKTS